MSTSEDAARLSEASVDAPSDPAGSVELAEGLRGSVLDPAVLSRLASEMFAALPGVAGAPAGLPSLAGIAGVGGGTGMPGLPSMSALPSPTSMPGTGGLPSLSAVPFASGAIPTGAPSPASIPGAPRTSTTPGTSPFAVAVPRVAGVPTNVSPSPTSRAPEPFSAFLPLAEVQVPVLGRFGGETVSGRDLFSRASAMGGPATAPSAGGFGAPFSSPAAAMPTGPMVIAPATPQAEHFYFLDQAAAPSPQAIPGVDAPLPTTSVPASAGASAPAAPSTPTVTSTFSPDLVPDVPSSRGTFDVISVRRDFPILEERVHGRPLIWLDNAATTQKPRAVIDRISDFYEHENSNIHRAAHTLAARATDAYEGAREKVRRFLKAGSTREIVFARGTTEAINLVAQSWGKRNVKEGDEILITWLEHHSNIVPWQMLCAQTGAKLRVAPVDDDGQVLMHEYEALLSSRTKLVSITQVSNALGTVTPAREMVQMAHRHGARVLVDGAQAVSHMPIDVVSLDCDFYVFSGHKVFGPTGIGAMYGKSEVLENAPPWQGGGNMIVDVTFEKTVYAPSPGRFEAGTGNIADAVGLGAALDYVEALGMENIATYEHALLDYMTEGLRAIPGLRIIGTAKEKAGVCSFVLDGFKSEEVGQALDRDGIAVRSGHHCAQPALRRFGLETSVRPSLALYNTKDEVDALVRSVRRLSSSRGRG